MYISVKFIPKSMYEKEIAQKDIVLGELHVKTVHAWKS